MRRKTYEGLFFFPFMRLCSKSPACNGIPVVSRAAAIISATCGQKELHWHLRKVILSGMYS